ncbi:MAG: MFS transporter [Methylocella sp.]
MLTKLDPSNKGGDIAGAKPAGALACAIAAVSIVGIGLSLTITLISVRLGEQGFSARAIGFNQAAAGVATLVVAGFVPRMARLIGVRQLLFLSLALCVLCLVAMAATDRYWAWFSIRAAFGAALTTLFVLSEYWINAIAPPERRGFVIGLYAASVAFGFAAGPFILALVGTESSAGFIVATALFVAAALPIIVGSGSAPEIETAPSIPVLAFLLAAPVATLAGLLHGAIETASMGLLPIYALRAGLTAETGALLVTLFALGNVVFQLPIGYVSDLIDRRKLLILIAFFSILGALALPFAQPGGVALFGALLLIWGGVVGSFYAVALGYLGSRYKGANLAGANAAFVMLYSAGMLSGPPVMGLGMDLLGPNGFFFSTAFVLTLYLGVVAWRGSREVS